MSGTEFQESSARPRAQQVPYAHLSIELDHLYMEDLQSESVDLGERMARVRPWFDAIVQSFTRANPGLRPRISTCVLIDDYFSSLIPPTAVLPRLRAAAAQAGLRIDYLAREACCAEYDGVSPALLAVDRLVPVPAAGTDGSRPPTLETGWLSNGRRSPARSRRSMRPSQGWLPPQQANARRHSVFVDVELWDEVDGKRVWSCAMLAAVWQLLRLGLLRDEGRPLVLPEPLERDAPLPGTWDGLPAVLQLEAKAAPFAGYRTASILDHRFMEVEHAVRVVLGQVRQNPEALDGLTERAERENLGAVDDVLGRIGYVFLPDREGAGAGG
jgi:hypothetical protein